MLYKRMYKIESIRLEGSFLWGHLLGGRCVPLLLEVVFLELLVHAVQLRPRVLIRDVSPVSLHFPHFLVKICDFR